MLCSVVIPLYNKARFIEATLQSVLNQSYPNFEIIVIDDGSKDDGPARAEAIADNRIRLMQQANQGVSRARNRGIELAKGDLICFLDADDWYLPPYLETIVTMAKENADISFFATSYKDVNAFADTGMVWDCGNFRKFEIVDDLCKRWRVAGPFFCTNTVAVRRALLIGQQPCFPPGESMGEDQDLWFRLAEKTPLLFCTAQLAAYRVDVPDGLCSTNEERALLPVYRRLEARALHRQTPDRFRASALRLVAHAKVGVARNLLISGKRFAALGKTLEAWREIGSRRWWVSLLMCMTASPAFLNRWEHWRKEQARNG